MDEEEKIAQGTYDFRNMRKDGYRYVDKTALLYPLVTRGMDSFFFISRPRRFGKSLMLSTLECLFRGERELFKGLAIDKMDYDWTEYPILHFNFAGLKVETLETFKIDFSSRVKETLTKAGCTWNDADFPGANFSRAINTLAEASEQKSVVVLIDEYDAPVGHALNDVPKAEAIRQELSNFYIQIKNNVGAIRFMMMTGVTKFTQLSVFSALNNLTDLTLQPEAKVMGLSYEDYRGQLRWWYNGYRFSPRCKTKVYNPLAIGRTLSRQSEFFEPTWSETGHSTALMKYLSAHPLTARDYECIPRVTRAVFDVYDLDNIGYLTFLYQGGYLTIKDFSPISGYTLGIPNEDIRQDLNQILVRPALRCWSMTSPPSSLASNPSTPASPMARRKTA